MNLETSLPFKSVEIKEFWDGVAKHKLLAQECKACGQKFFPPSNHCPKCLSKDFKWFELSGKGKLYSWTHALYTLTPHYVGIIDIDEGFSRIISRLRTNGKTPKIGDSVEVSFFVFENEPLFEFKLIKS
jgi:uncharacterized OB-fold protein